MMRLNLKQRVNNTALPRSKPLLPVLEAIVNSFQALEELGTVAGKFIRVTVERDSVAFEEDAESVARSPINGFIVEDNGVGFNDPNMASFLTSDSDYKAARGGKGVGRFMWLKAFGRAQVESTFGNGVLRDRDFVFSLGADLSDAGATPSVRSVRLTKVILKDFLTPYKEDSPRSLDIVAQRIVEHCLAFFMDPDCPSVTLVGPGESFDLNDYFGKYIGDRATNHTFVAGGHSFGFRGVRLYHVAERANALILAANKREVRSLKLERSIPTLHARLEDESGEPFVYLGFVTGEYLDGNVTTERTGFMFPDAVGEVQSVLPMLTLDEIRAAALNLVRDDLWQFIDKLNTQKAIHIENFISETAPQFQPMKRYWNEILEHVPSGLSNDQLEIALYKLQHEKQVELKVRGQEILSEEPEDAAFDGYVQRLNEFMDELNDLGKAELAQYVAHRKVVLDFFEKSMRVDPVTGKQALEETLHKIVFPMRKTSEEVPYELQNLWLLDERLTYHRFLTSDKKLARTKPLDSDSELRPDILIFDRAMAFTEDDSPVSSFVVVEFKRPERRDLKSDNPISQVYGLIRELRTNRFKDVFGREIKLQSQTIPAYAFIVCDLTSYMERLAEDAGLQKTPDKLGYFGYNPQLDAYVEVLSYIKILRDAQKRNRVFFDKLNIQHHTDPQEP